MVVMVLEKVTPSLRGELSRWLIEVSSGVYVGHVTARVRDRLWTKCADRRGAGRVFQAWNTNNEQRFSMRLSGSKTRRIVDWEGVLLVEELKEELTAPQKRRIKPQKMG